MAFQIGWKTDVGRWRFKNEDAFYVDQEGGLFIVADGLGGHQAGEVASMMAVQEIIKYFEKPGKGGALTEGSLAEAVERANEQIHARSFQDTSLCGMGTTVVLAVMKGRKLWLAHVGDSRAYLFSDEGLRQLTQDHTVTHEFVDGGETNREETVWRPYRGILSRAVGTEKTVEVDTQELTYRGELLVLCTDGLTDMVKDKEIEDILLANRDPQKACEALVEMANLKGGIDNITVVIVRDVEGG